MHESDGQIYEQARDEEIWVNPTYNTYTSFYLVAALYVELWIGVHAFQ